MVIESADPDVTIAVVPREQWGVVRASLESIFEHTPESFELIYVDGGSPPDASRWLREESERRGFRLLRSDGYLTPNQARNWALRHAHGRYIVFVDNDLIVSPGWLSAMITCAEETGAWAVGPLYLEGDPTDDVIHMAGGWFELAGVAPERSFTTKHLFQGEHLRDRPAPLSRDTCDFVEFHCMLVPREVFDRLGDLDEALLNTREHLDLCLQIREAGGEVFFEPAAVVTYKAPPPLERTDLAYFLTRWSEEWTRRSLERFVEKWGIAQSYLERAHIARARRRVALGGVASATERLLGARARGALEAVLRRAEPPLNRALVRGAPRAPEGLEPPAGGGHAR